MIVKNKKLFLIIMILILFFIFVVLITKLASSIILKNQDITIHLLEDSEKIEVIPVNWTKHDKVLAPDFSDLYYVSDNYIVFKVNTGLFVYKFDTDGIFRSLDLELIDCHYIQGDNYCEILVSDDGKYIYLHPMLNNKMYIYVVEENNLFYLPFNLDMINSLKTFDNFIDIAELDLIFDGVISGRIIEFMDKKANEVKYGYLLTKSPYKLNDVQFISGDKAISLFTSE